MKRKLSYVLCLVLLVASLAGLSSVSALQDNPQKVSAKLNSAINSKSAPKYIFMFIGDGMGFAQINSAQVYEGNNISGEVALEKMNFTQFPAAGSSDNTGFYLILS